MQMIRVWDLPVRFGHWLLAGSFILAWFTADSEEWRLVHVYAGGTMFAVALFRLVWGFVGSRHALFTSFVRSPSAALIYLKNLTRLTPPHYTGHNPAGGLAIVLLLALAIAAGMTGWLVYQEIAGDRVVSLHNILANVLLALVMLHLAGVAAGSLVHGENLVRAMITGHKLGNTAEAIHRPRYLATGLLIVWTLLASWWLAQ